MSVTTSVDVRNGVGELASNAYTLTLGHAEKIREIEHDEMEAASEREEARFRMAMLRSSFIEEGLSGTNERERSANLDLRCASDRAYQKAFDDELRADRTYKRLQIEGHYYNRLYQIHLALLGREVQRIAS